MTNDNRNELDRERLEREGMLGSTRDVRDGEARLTLSEEELAIQKRQAAAGEVGIEKRVETEHVRRSVPTMRDEVTIERHPVDGMHATGATIGEESVSIPLSREEVHAEKRVVAKEELVVKKHQVQGEQMVEADLRREEADVHHSGDVRLRDDQLRGSQDRDGLR